MSTISTGPVHLPPLSLNPANGVTVFWNAVPGRTYRVQYKNEIEEPGWTDLQGEIIATSSTGAKLDASTQDEAKRLYRVMALP